MSQTVVVGIRLDREDAEQFKQQAERYGLTRSAAGAVLIEGHLDYERQVREDSDARR